MKKTRREAPLHVRPGTERDIPTIAQMIYELAEYEHLASEVKVTAAILKRDGFGRGPYFSTLVCERIDQSVRDAGSRVIGYALYFFTYSTFVARPTLYVEDLYVRPEARGKGAGKMLLSAMARVALERECGRMEWAVIDFNAPAIRFYKKIGAKLRTEWMLTRLTGTKLRRLAVDRKAAHGLGLFIDMNR